MIKLFSFVNYFREQAEQYSSINLLASNSPIQGILLRGNENAKRISAKCAENNLDVRAILSPTVAEGEERLRVVIHAYNHPLEIDELLRIIAEAS